jgi:hypothetical protein
LRHPREPCLSKPVVAQTTKDQRHGLSPSDEDHGLSPSDEDQDHPKTIYI